MGWIWVALWVFFSEFFAFFKIFCVMTALSQNFFYVYYSCPFTLFLVFLFLFFASYYFLFLYLNWFCSMYNLVYRFWQQLCFSKKLLLFIILPFSRGLFFLLRLFKLKNLTVSQQVKKRFLHSFQIHYMSILT